MSDDWTLPDLSAWNLALDAAVAASRNHKVLFEDDKLRVLEVMLDPNEEEPTHHHHWPSVVVLDQVQGPVHDVAPDGTMLRPKRDEIQAWNGQGSLVVHMAPQLPGRVLNVSDHPIHGIRVEMKPWRQGRPAAQARDRACRGGGFPAARNRPLTAQICRALLRPDALGSGRWDPIDPP